jgi:subtilisin-like proprotein convertase family protein
MNIKGTAAMWASLPSISEPRRLARGAQVHLEKSTSPYAPIQDFETTRSTIDIKEPATIRGLKLQTNIEHDYRGDLVVTLISPQGRSYPVVDRQGGSEDNLQGTFDLSQVFRGDEARGTWTLSISDVSGGDLGTLNGWGLVIDGVGSGGDEPK